MREAKLKQKYTLKMIMRPIVLVVNEFLMIVCVCVTQRNSIEKSGKTDDCFVKLDGLDV